MDVSHEPSIEAMARRVHEIVEIFNTHDLEKLADQYAEDVVLTEPTYPEPRYGRAVIVQDAEALFTALPDAQLIVEDLVVEGYNAAARLVTVGTHTGSFVLPDGEEVPPTGNEVRLRYGFFDRYGIDGRILEERRFTDVVDMLRQFGVGG